MLAEEECRLWVWRSCIYLFICLFFLKKAIWFLPSLSFLKRWCVFLPSMRTVQLFCVLFSSCVYSRPSTVTYLIFVTVTKVITYSIDVYIQHIIWKQCERRDSLCCTSLSLDRLFHGFFFSYVVLILALESKGVSLMWRNRCDKSM